MKRLVITADDFGLAEEVNEAVEQAHRGGVLSAASLMVGGPAAADAVRRARALPSLCVGLHLTLVEAAPTLAPERIPALVDGAGRLRCDMARLGFEIALRPEVRRQARAEIAAQFAAFRDTGLPLDHVNAHKHFHLHPLIGADILAIGSRFGMKALRTPWEPRDILMRIEPDSKIGRGLGPLAARLRAGARRAGIIAPDAIFGLAWTGALTAERLAGLIAQAPDGLVEIYGHPAVADAFPGHAPGYRYVEERDALLASQARKALAAADLRLGGYLR